MLIQLLDYSIENEGSTNAWANISITIDDIGPIRETPNKPAPIRL